MLAEDIAIETQECIVRGITAYPLIDDAHCEAFFEQGNVAVLLRRCADTGGETVSQCDDLRPPRREIRDGVLRRGDAHCLPDHPHREDPDDDQKFVYVIRLHEPILAYSLTSAENNLDCSRDGFWYMKELPMARKNWREKRAGQGFSYDEVLTEMGRRVKGERIFNKKDAALRFDEGVKRLGRAYRCSALLNDFLEKEGMTYEDLCALTGTEDNEDTLHLLIDPVPRMKDQDSLRNDYNAHCFYPGADIPFEE